MSDPQVSVVMGVHNGGDALEATLDSVLEQKGVELELIVVDDGSTDQTAEILARRSVADARLRVLTQPHNLGLTTALIRGCDQARGEFIARQDCGDRSLGGRLARQAAILSLEGRAVAVTSGARFIAPRGEVLSEVILHGAAWQDQMRILEIARIKGPAHHGATMFRRSAYHAVGGYRSAFVVAQDLDLWLRFSEIGELRADPVIGYEAEVRAGSISASNRATQMCLAQYALDCARARREGADEADVKMPKVNGRTRKSAFTKWLAASSFEYFVASVLIPTNPAAARYYLLSAIKKNPLNPKYWVKLTKVIR